MVEDECTDAVHVAAIIMSSSRSASNTRTRIPPPPIAIVADRQVANHCSTLTPNANASAEFEGRSAVYKEGEEEEMVYRGGGNERYTLVECGVRECV